RSARALETAGTPLPAAGAPSAASLAVRLDHGAWTSANDSRALRVVLGRNGGVSPPSRRSRESGRFARRGTRGASSPPARENRGTCVAGRSSRRSPPVAPDLRAVSRRARLRARRAHGGTGGSAIAALP